MRTLITSQIKPFLIIRSLFGMLILNKHKEEILKLEKSIC